MPNLQAEHFSEYSEVFQDFTNPDSSNVKAYEFFKLIQLPPTSHWDHLSLYADSNDEFNSHSEDAQDLVPDNTDPVLESQSESLQRTWDLLTLLKKLLNFFRPTCFLGKLKSC